MPAQNMLNRRRIRRAAGDPLGIMGSVPDEFRAEGTGEERRLVSTKRTPTPGEQIGMGGTSPNPQFGGVTPGGEKTNRSIIRDRAPTPPEESPERQARRRRRRVG